MEDQITLQTILFIGFLFWITVVATGTFFYHYYEGWDWGFSFYYAMSLGSQTGFGISYMESDGSKTFSSFYMICAYTGFSLTLIWMTSCVLVHKSDWYKNLLNDREIGKDNRKGFWLYYLDYIHAINILWLVVIFFLLGILFYNLYVGFDTTDSFYFVISAMTATGAMSIPDESEDWVYGYTGLWLGITTMLVASTFFYHIYNVIGFEAKYKALKAINTKWTIDELKGIRELGLNSSLGEIDKNEFCLIMAMRMNVIDTDLLKLFIDEFNDLDSRKSGKLLVTTLLKENDRLNGIEEFEYLLPAKEQDTAKINDIGYGATKQ